MRTTNALVAEDKESCPIVWECKALQWTCESAHCAPVGFASMWSFINVPRRHGLEIEYDEYLE